MPRNAVGRWLEWGIAFAVVTGCVVLTAGGGCGGGCSGCRPGPDGTAGQQTPGSPSGRPGMQTPASPQGRPGVPTPSTPRPRPSVQTPSSPAPKPAAAVDEAPAPEPVAKPLPEQAELRLEDLGRVEQGMTLEEVRGILGAAGQPIGSDSLTTAILKWTDANGTSFLARFENGKLARKSTFKPGGAGSEDADKNQPMLTRTDYDRVREGMSVQEVLAMLSVRGKAISNDKVDTVIYKWQDAAGSNFTAKFENGQLVRKTGFHVAPKPAESGPAQTPRATAPAPEAGGAETTEARPEPAAEAVPLEPEGEPPLLEEPVPAAPAEQAVPPGAAPAPKRVIVAGADRRAAEAESRDPRIPSGSYRPKAKLPDYTWSLRRGSYEVRINNPSGAKVKAGLRTDKGGTDVTVPANGARSVYVDRGQYSLYFIYDDDPYSIYQGPAINLDGDRYADVQVDLINESYEVRSMDLNEYLGY